MGGWLKAPLVPDEHEVMGKLVRYGLFKLIGEGVRLRYALTAVGEQLAAQIANR